MTKANNEVKDKVKKNKLEQDANKIIEQKLKLFG